MPTRIKKLKDFEIDGFKPFENIHAYHIADFLVSHMSCKKCPIIKDQDELDECNMCFENLKDWFLGECEEKNEDI